MKKSIISIILPVLFLGMKALCVTPAFAQDFVHADTFVEHRGLVRALAFSPDGQILASAGADTLIHLWHPTTGTLLRSLRGHTKTVTSVAFSPDGGLLVSASVDGSIRLWNPQTGRELRRIPNAHPEGVQSVDFSADGGLLASGGRDNTVRLWNAQTWGLISTLRGHTDWVLEVDFSETGLLASASRDRTIRLWSSKGQYIRSLRGHTDFVTSVAFASTGELVSGSRDLTVRSWNPQTGAPLRVFRGHTGHINQVSVSVDGTIASPSADETVRLWELRTGAPIEAFHDATDVVRVVAFSPNGRLLASGDESGNVLLWQGERDQPPVVDRNTQVHTPDPNLRTAFVYADTFVAHNGLVRALAFSPDGQILASAGADTIIHLWNPTTGALLRSLRGHTKTVTSVAFSPDGRLLASSSVDGSIRLWNPQTGGLLRTLAGAHPAGVQSVAFSPDGRVLASGGRDNTVRLWNTQTWGLISTLRGHTDWVLEVAFSREGLLASASRDRSIRLWSSGGGHFRSLSGHTDYVTSVAFVSTGELVSGSRDSTVRSWNPQTGDPLRVFRGHTGHVNQVAVSGSGLIASPSADETVRLWQLRTGVPIEAFDDATDVVRVVAFSPNGRLLASGDESGTVLLWQQERDQPPTGGDRSLCLTPQFNPHPPPSNDPIDGRFPILVVTNKIWTPEHTTYEENLASGIDGIALTVGFEGGDSYKRNLVKTHAPAWSEYCAVHFLFPETSDEWDIIVSFNEGADVASWSHIGTHSLLFARDGIPSMNLNFGGTYCGGSRGLILHEFGHALGLTHEHKSPSPTNPIDIPTAIADARPYFEKLNRAYALRLNWTSEQLEVAIQRDLDTNYKILSEGSSNFSIFDPSSIMLYAGLPLKGGGYTTCNGDLSVLDKQSIGVIYPPSLLRPGLHFWASMSMEGLDDEGIISDERIYVKEFPLYITIDRDWDSEDYTYVPLPQFKWGGECRLEVELGARRVLGAAAEVAIRLRLFEGVSENTTDLDGEETYEFLVGYDGIFGDDWTVLLSRRFLVRNEEDGEDWAAVTLSLKRAVQLAALAPGNEPGNLLSASDTNGDGQINVADLILVSNYLGQPAPGTPPVDINRDGTATITDLVHVAQYLGRSTYAAAPTRVVVPEGLRYATVEAWIDQARAADDGSLVFREGIGKLEFLLTLIIPEKTVLLPNYPNPFNPETWIPYHLSEPAKVTLTIYSIDGKVVRHLDLGHQAAGYYQNKARAAYWDGRNNVSERVASGIYFHTLTAGDFVATKKMLIKK